MVESISEKVLHLY